MDITVEQTELPSVVIITPNVIRDPRGFFMESFNRREFEQHGLLSDYVQDNHSRSAHKVVRGLHFQDMRAPMVKLVRCTAGAILDVAVDIRVGSPTFGRWVGVELSADNAKQLLVPVGFAHGFATLSDYAEVQYKCSGYYAPETEGCIAWNDPDLNITWPFSDPILSKRDMTAMSLRRYQERPSFVYAHRG
jgi:dTDP-4-dehydrorhamnose 3,5-epimerase